MRRAVFALCSALAAGCGEVSLGYFRTLRQRAGVILGVGARGTVNLVPPSLRDSYGGRWPVGAAVYVALRPRDTRHEHGGGERQ